jgi:putative transposase
MSVRYTYRLRVSATARRALEREWGLARWVWNQSVATSRDAHTAGEECGPAKLDRALTGWRQAQPWLAEGSSVVQQQTVRDFAAARAKALKDRKNKVPIHARRGLPRFKAKARALPSMNYTQRGFTLKDQVLCLAGGIHIRPVWSRNLPSVPTSVRVYRDTTGAWWASFVVQVMTDPLVAVDSSVGIDWGVTETATATDPACDLAHAEHGRRQAARLARYQRQMARRRPKPGRPASNGYRQAKVATAKVYRQTAWRRRDDTRKWAKRVVRTHDRIAVEDFKPRFLASSTMARKAADGAIATAKAELVHMAVKHGRDLRLVNPAFSTMDCGDCGARTKHRLPLSERTYTCLSCGNVRPRDRNSATVMVARAGFVPAGVDRVRLESPLGDSSSVNQESPGFSRGEDSTVEALDLFRAYSSCRVAPDLGDYLSPFYGLVPGTWLC